MSATATHHRARVSPETIASSPAILAPFAAAGPASISARVVVATVERLQGDTGIHAHTRTLLSGLRSAGVGARIVNPFGGSVKWLPVFALRRAIDPFSRTRGTRWYRRTHLDALRENLVRDLSRQPADIVVAQCPLSARAALDARSQSRRDFHVAAVCHFNFSEAEEYRAKGELDDAGSYDAILRLERDVLESVDQVIYVSGWARRVVEGERGIRPKASRVIWNGISTDLDAMPKIARADLGLDGDDVVLINVGTLEPRKDQVGLLDLFARIVAEFPRTRLLLIGDGPQRREIERKVQAIGLVGRVRLLGHRVDVPALLAIADVYVHHASLENCPVVLLEAARAGLPGAAVPVGGIPELQQELGDAAVALDAADTDRSLAALRPILSDRERRAAMGRTARDRFLRRFTREAMIRAYLDALPVRVPPPQEAT